jgi:hypothetical protein
MSLTQQEKKKLEEINKQQEYVDNTDGIRRLKHSHLIRNEILKMEKLKKEKKELREENLPAFAQLCQTTCTFLYNSYTDIYHRVYKDELDLSLMYETLNTLEKIEEGDINQEEGSVLMGKLFYKVFVESAIKRDLEKDKEKIQKKEEKPYTWKQYKTDHFPPN